LDALDSAAFPNRVAQWHVGVARIPTAARQLRLEPDSLSPWGAIDFESDDTGAGGDRLAPDASDPAQHAAVDGQRRPGDEPGALRAEERRGPPHLLRTADPAGRDALGGLVGGYPFGYMLCSLAALVVVPLWGWRSLYFLGILPALLVLWIRIGIKESPRYERVTAAMLKEGLKKQLDIFAPVRQYPREMLIASLVYFFYLFTWLGWSAWMPFYLANEKHLGFPAMSKYLSAWMFCAIFAYWICGYLCDLYGRRWVIPAFAVPAAVLLVTMGHLDDPSSLFWVGLATNFLITGSFGTGLGYTAELFPTQIRGTAVGASFTFGLAAASLAPMIMGWIATASSIAAGLPLLALSFLMLAPLFIWFAPDMTRKELTDFVGEKVG